MPSPSSTYEGIVPTPPSVVAIRHGIFQPTDEPGLSVSVPTTYDLYVGETAPTDDIGRNGDWYMFVDTDSIKTYRKVTDAWTLIATMGAEEGPPGPPGEGTVNSVSVVTANGVSAVVLNPTTDPSLTFSLGAITPTSVAATGNVTGANLSGTNTGDLPIVSQAEAEAGVSTTGRTWTAERVAQAIAALAGGGGGTGDVVGPASSVDSRPALFDGITGKLLKQASATLGTAAFAATSAFDAAGAAAAAQAASQPLDSDLTAIAALTTTSFGRSFLELANSAAGRTLLDLVIGTNVQAYDADLTTWAGLTPSANAQSLVTAADYAAMRTLLGLVIGTNVQAYDADLTTWAGLTPSANAQSLVTAADYAAMRTLLGLVIGTNVQAFDADLTTWAGITPGAGVGTFLATPSSANLRAALTDEVGTGPAMFTRTGVVREIWIGAGAMTPTTTNGAATGSYTPSGADVATIDVFAFDDTTAESVQFTIGMPAEWDLGTVKVKAYWTSTSGTGNVEFEVAAGAASNDDALGAILGTAVAIVDTVITSDDLHISPASGAITVGGTPALDDMVLFKITRDTATGSDKTGDALLIGVKLQYTESTTEPSAW